MKIAKNHLTSLTALMSPSRLQCGVVTGLPGAHRTAEQNQQSQGEIKQTVYSWNIPEYLGLPYKTLFYTLIPSEHHVTHQVLKIYTIRVVGTTSSRWPITGMAELQKH